MRFSTDMPSPTLNYVLCPDPPIAGRHTETEAGRSPDPATHRMAYWQWGSADAADVVVCVHGLSRQGRDFDVLAQALIARSGTPLRIVCPDVVGRGRSDWLKDPMGYALPTYAADMLAMLAQLHRQSPIARLDWVGTSMGGLIGMAIAGSRHLSLPAPVRRIVLNDVGPAIQWQALQRIGTYLGNTGQFESVQHAADAMWAISSTFGPHTPDEWLALSHPMVRAIESGGVTLHYDPAIAVPFRELTQEAAEQGQSALWQLYDNIRADVLITRGADSDLLLRQTAEAMTRRGPGARLIEFPGVGHAPTLISNEQVACVASFLLDTDHEKPGGGAT